MLLDFPPTFRADGLPIWKRAETPSTNIQWIGHVCTSPLRNRVMGPILERIPRFVKNSGKNFHPCSGTSCCTVFSEQGVSADVPGSCAWEVYLFGGKCLYWTGISWQQKLLLWKVSASGSIFPQAFLLARSVSLEPNGSLNGGR